MTDQEHNEIKKEAIQGVQARMENVLRNIWNKGFELGLKIGKEKDRPKGWWIEVEEDEDLYRCSACENEWVTIEGTPTENNMHYCPKCGARMGGTEKKYVEYFC